MKLGYLLERGNDRFPLFPHSAVCYFQVGDSERPLGFNPAMRIAPERRALAAAEFMTRATHAGSLFENPGGKPW